MDKRNKRIITEISKYSKFILDFAKLVRGKTTSNMSIWQRLKVFYYIVIKYRRIMNGINSCIKSDVHRIATKHENFIEIVVSYIYIIESIKSKFGGSDEFISSILKSTTGTTSLDIRSFDNPNGGLAKYKVTVFGLSMVNIFFVGKACKSILEIDTEKSNYSLDFTVYDLDTVENQQALINAKVLYRKIFQIQPDGNLYNPNFKLDVEIEAQDTMEYIWSCLFTISPILNLIAGFTSLEFVGYKSE